MGAWKGRGAKSFLCFIHHFAFWYAQDESSLIWCGSSGGYPVTTFPPPVYSFTWIKKI